LSGFQPRFSSHDPAETWVAIARVFLAGFSLLAAWLDPPGSTQYSRLTDALLVSYAIYAVVVLGLMGVLRRLPGGWAITTQILDLAAFVAFVPLTRGPNSPFFIYFTFSLICGTVRWQWRGTLWTTFALILAYFVVAFFAGRLTHLPDFDLRTVVTRSAQLVVVGGLLSYLGLQEERSAAEKIHLAAWPRRETIELGTLVSELLDDSAAILGAPRMLMIWEQPADRRIHFASRSRDGLEIRNEDLSAFGPMVAKPLADASFLCANAADKDALVVWRSPHGTRELAATAPLDPGLQERFGIGAVLSWTLRGETIEGRLFALDKTGMTVDDLVLGEIVAGLTAARMDHFALRERLQESAATEERIRLSWDLHDGLLQSLTGIALQLQASRRLLDQDPGAARERLAEIQSSIASEQHDLRAFVNRLKETSRGGNEVSGIRLRLEELCSRIERQWGLHVNLTSDGPLGELPSPLPDNIVRIVHEALVNAARHAQASSLAVSVVVKDRAPLITVADDGHGFSFRGTFDLPTLQRLKAGPITLRERIASLGGGLVISSSESGSRLEISLPPPEEA
jgi:signal transduction histidine kinase